MTPAAIDQLARAVMAMLADTAARALVLACVMGATLVVLRVKASAVRLQAWTLLLYAVLALPIAAAVMPAWRWPAPHLLTLVDWQPSAGVSSSVTAGVSTAAGDTATTPALAPGRGRMSVASWALAIYLAGVLLLAVHAGLAWWLTSRLRRSARPIADDDLCARVARHAAAARVSRAPRAVESSRLLVPVTMSVVDPIVLLPDSWRTWSIEKLDAVLAHEIAHVGRRDALTQRLSLVARALFWCNPLSWWLHRHLSDLADQASDDAALAAGIAPAVYAEALLDFFADLQRGPRRAEWHLAMARGADHDAARRVERILSWKGGPIMKYSRVLLAGMVLALAPVVALTAAVRFTPAAVPMASADVADARSTQTPVVPASLAAPVTSAAPTAAPASSDQAVRTAPVAAPRPVTTVDTAVAPTTSALAVMAEPAVQKPTTKDPDDDFAKDAYEPGTKGLIAPIPLQKPDPKYTSAALRAKIQGTVEVEAIVMADGTVSKTRVKASLDKAFGLDEQALIAVKQWTFTPGTMNDQPVPVHVTYTLQFRVH